MESHFPSSNYQRKLHQAADHFRLTKRPLVRALIAEFCGSAILIIIGCGVSAQVILGDFGQAAHGGFLSLSLGWGAALSLGVLFSICNGSGHVNPAITLASAIIGRTQFKRVPLYLLSQVFGCALGAFVVFVIYQEQIATFDLVHTETSLGLKRSDEIFITSPRGSIVVCLFDQILGTAILTTAALASGDASSAYLGIPTNPVVQPIYVGMVYFALMSGYCLNAGCPLNPARELGPRMALALVNKTLSVFTASNYYFWIPIVGPFTGALLGAIFYEVTIGIHLDRGVPTQCSHNNEVPQRSRRKPWPN